jgi:hypothetical protein
MAGNELLHLVQERQDFLRRTAAEVDHHDLLTLMGDEGNTLIHKGLRERSFRSLVVGRSSLATRWLNLRSKTLPRIPGGVRVVAMPPPTTILHRTAND